MLVCISCSQEVTYESLNTEAIKAFQKNKYDQAIEKLEKAIKMEPEKTEAYNNIVKALIRKAMVSPGNRRDNLVKALLSAKHAVMLKPDSSDALTNLAYAYSVLGEYGEAIPVYKKAIQINSDFSKPQTDNFNQWQARNSIVDAYTGLAFSYGAIGDYNKAVTYYQKAITLNDQNPYIYYNLGRTNYINNKLDQAIVNYEKAINLMSNDPGFYNELGKSYGYQKEFEKAEQSFKKAIALKKSYPDPYFNLGILYEATNDIEGALEEYKRLSKIAPGYPGVEERISALERLQKRSEK
jgi:tetratricopeptide (TPR) repeat protein